MTHSPPHGFRNNFRPLSILYYAFCFQAVNSFLFCNPDLNHLQNLSLQAQTADNQANYQLLIKNRVLKLFNGDLRSRRCAVATVSRSPFRSLLIYLSILNPGVKIFNYSPLIPILWKIALFNSFFLFFTLH